MSSVPTLSEAAHLQLEEAMRIFLDYTDPSTSEKRIIASTIRSLRQKLVEALDDAKGDLVSAVSNTIDAIEFFNAWVEDGADIDPAVVDAAPNAAQSHKYGEYLELTRLLKAPQRITGAYTGVGASGLVNPSTASRRRGTQRRVDEHLSKHVKGTEKSLHYINPLGPRGINNKDAQLKQLMELNDHVLKYGTIPDGFDELAVRYILLASLKEGEHYHYVNGKPLFHVRIGAVTLEEPDEVLAFLNIKEFCFILRECWKCGNSWGINSGLTRNSLAVFSPSGVEEMAYKSLIRTSKSLRMAQVQGLNYQTGLERSGFHEADDDGKLRSAMGGRGSINSENSGE